MPSKISHDENADVLGFHVDVPRKHSHNVFVNQAFTLGDSNANNDGATRIGSAGARLNGSNNDDYSNSDNNGEVKKEKESEPDNSQTEDEFKNLLPFCVVFGLGSLFSQSISTYLSSQITVIEKVFGLSSTKSGFLLSANDIGFISTVLFASHFLKNNHIPRVLGACLLLFGLSGMVTSLPHFLSAGGLEVMTSSSHNATHNTRDALLCVPGSTKSINTSTGQCSTHAQSNSEVGSGSVEWTLILIAAMMIIQGVAKGPRQPLGNTYIDNNSTKTNTGFYLSVLMSFTIFGPFMAQTAGGLFNKIPVDLKETSLTPEDPRWIGAWWIGFLVFGACSVLISVPVFFFPASLRKTPEQPDIRSSEYMNAANVTEKKKTILQLAAGMPRSIMRILTRPVYVTHVIGALFNIMAILALGSFGPKYVENQFRIPTWKANIIQGVEKLATTSIGTLAGGIVTKRLQLRMTGCIKMVVFTRAVGLVFHAFNFMFGCDNPQVIGYDIPSRVATNLSCLCSDTSYMPVCADGNTYFSPCHAGCKTEIDGMYTDCAASVSGQVYSGMCDTGCNYLVPYVIMNAMSSLIQTAGISPSFVIIIRSVKEKDRSMAVGLQSFLMALLVFLPSPIIYGKIFDTICLVWKAASTCPGSDVISTKVGACSLYDVRGMRMKFMSIDCGLKAASVLLSFVTLYFIKRQLQRDEQQSKDIVINKPPVPQPRTSIGGQERGE